MSEGGYTTPDVPAPRAILIDVTQADIDRADAYGLQGARCNGAECPLASAAERAFGVPCRVQRPYIMVGDSEKLAWLPSAAREFVWHYDLQHRELIRPFQFYVEDPR